MKVSLVLQLHHSNYYTTTTSATPSPFYRSSSSFVKLRTSCSISRGSRIILPRLKQEQVAARDMMIDFGRYKGKMLGTLPSTYLKWVSNNLRAQDFHLNWSILADQVLADPVYRDRIEWEFAQKLLNGDVKSDMATTSSKGGVAELLAEISERFGWDKDDKLGWSRIDFTLLGTSKGKPIPRKKETSTINKDTLAAGNDVDSGDNNIIIGSSSNKRSERRERLRMKRSSGGGDMEKITKSSGSGKDHIMMIKKNHPNIIVNTSPYPFPGRESLLSKRRS